ncbi:MAG: hypothetical protein ACTHZW_07035 [Microbacteriaceae bacterium]
MTDLRPIGWSLAIASLTFSAVGVFWLRLWILGLVVGVAALVVSVVAVRRRGNRPSFADPLVVVSALALAVPIVIAVITIIGSLTRLDTGPPRDELQVEIRVQAEGDFTVTYTEPPASGASQATVAEVAATDEFEESYTTRLSEIQFFAAIAPNNIGPQSISCEILINGTTVVDQTEEGRFIDCSSDLQELYRELTSK